jgi:threonine dehydrogenase-like Zn-dependent dehydrogenase
MTVVNPRALLTAPRKIELAAAELAEAVPAGHVRVRALRSLISPGTELRMYRGLSLPPGLWRAFAQLDRVEVVQRAGEPGADDGRPVFPAALGYNLLGEVVASGSGVSKPALGDRVLSLARHQAIVDLPAWQAVPVPAGVPDEAAVCGYVPTLGLHALRQAEHRAGEQVAVVGLGLVGAAAALLAEAMGARVSAVEPAAERGMLVSRIAPGIEVFRPEEAEHRAQSADVVIEAAGTPEALMLSLRLARQRGRVAVLALHQEELGPILAGDFYLKELRLIGTRNAPYEDPLTSKSRHTNASNIESVLGLAASGRLDLAGLVTTVVPWSELPRAFAEFDAGVSDRLGVVVDWSGAPVSA